MHTKKTDATEANVKWSSHGTMLQFDIGYLAISCFMQQESAVIQF